MKVAEQGPRRGVKAGPPRVRVSRGGDGDYGSIAEALRSAPGAVGITVGPGEYRESLVVDRDVEIVGELTPDAGVVIESAEGPCLRVTNGHLMVRNVTLHSVATVGNVSGGAVLMEGSTLRGQDRLREQGVPLPGAERAVNSPSCSVTVEDCEITCGDNPGLLVACDGVQVSLNRCEVLDCVGGGVVVASRANVRLVSCQLDGNGSPDGHGWWVGGLSYAGEPSGVDVGDGTVEMVDCVVRNGASNGVYVYSHGRLAATDCVSAGNQRENVVALGGGNVRLARCVIEGAGGAGVRSTWTARGHSAIARCRPAAARGSSCWSGWKPGVRSGWSGAECMTTG